MAVKELLTRIALKYDEYKNWMDPEKGGKLVLLKGEIGLCEVPTTATGDDKATNAPTVLFKVGDGTKTFSELQWASAKAADVYSWAKASDVVYDSTAKTITFVKGNEDGTDKVFTFNYVTATEVDSQIKAITNSISSKVTALEGKFGEDGEVTVALADHESRLDIIEGEGDGSIKKAAQEAQAAAEATAASKASAAETAAKEHATGLNTAMDNRVKPLEAAKANHEGRIGTVEGAINTINTTAIPGLVDDYKAADKAITDTIGGSYTSTDTVDKAIKAAKQAADDAQADVDALVADGGKVTKNTADIAQNKADIAAEVKARTDADTALSERLDSIEAFFDAADHDGEDGGLTDALDTLKEIQDYLNGEGSATNGIIGRVAAAEKDIDDLEAEFADGGRVKQAEADIDAVEGRATALEGRADALETLTGADGAIRAEIKAAKDQADKGVADAKDAKDAADAAQGEVDALEGVVAGVKTTAETASSEATRAHGRLDTVDGKISTLEATTLTGDDSNANLRSAITSLQAITGSDAANSNAKLREDITALNTQINADATGILARLTSAESKISAVEGNYLKADDAYIFQCGDASAPNHMPAQN